MSRTTIEFKCDNIKKTQDKISSILRSHKYKYIEENNENVWKCGVGFWTAMKYIKVEYGQDNTVYVSGWIRAVAGSEMDLKGFVGLIPKKQVLSVIKEITNS